MPVGCFNQTESLITTKKTWPVMFHSDPGPTKRGKPILKADTGWVSDGVKQAIYY